MQDGLHEETESALEQELMQDGLHEEMEQKVRA